MPGKVGVKIKAGRNLPVMDRGSDTTDAYVEIKLGNVTHKTDVCRKSLNPQWNTDWYRFEVDDAELQDEPLQIRLMDYDTYSANDAIGKVNISLNPLCIENAGQANPGKGAVMSGWIPVFDTMHGIRGEVNIIVKVDLFSDANKFRQSSCGVQFFHSPNVPHGYRAQIIHGFVEELVVNDDPEYQWIDKIRTPRASNEARQVVFLRLSGQVQRKIGLKAINLGANAVIGYTQCFDLEGDVGVVARGIGTAVTLVKILENIPQPLQDNALIEERTLKYLEFLTGNGKGSEGLYPSKFDSDTITDSGNLVYKILGIDTLDKSNTKSPNIILNKKWKPSSSDNTIPEENTDNEGLKQLFQQEDMRGEKVTRHFRRHMRKITHSSKNLFNEKFNAIKAKLNDDKSEKDTSSLNSSYSDISTRNSLADIRGMMRLKKKKNQNYKRSVSDGFGMATLLVNSLMLDPSLHSISEGQDSGKSSPSQTLKRNKDDKSESLPQSPVEQLKFLHPTLQKNILHVSDTSMSTVSISSSTTEEEGFSDECSETTTNEIVIVDADTVSMVVKSVLAQETLDTDANNWIEPGSTRKIEKNGNFSNNRLINIRQLSADSSNKSDEPSSKTCILTGGTRIIKEHKDACLNESELIEKTSTTQRMGTLLKNPSVDEDSENWIEPGSTTDEPENIEVARRGSLLHDLKENLTETFHHIQEHIHFPHFTEDKHKHGLLATAMETMLIEKAEMCGVEPNMVSDQNDEEIHLKKEHDSKSAIVEPSHKKFHLPFYHKNKKPEIKNNCDRICPNSSNGSVEMKRKFNNINNSESLNEIQILSELNSSENIDEILIETSTNVVENKPKISKKFEIYTLPAISLTSLEENKLQISKKFEIFTIPAISLTSLDDENNLYYSSEPQLLTQRNTPISQTPLRMPFTSLVDLTTKSDSLTCYELDSPINNSIPSIIPNPGPNSSDINNSSIVSNISEQLESSNDLQLISNKLNNLDSKARNNVISSSYTNLSTNKAPMLAPFPYLKHHRSELISGSTSPGGSGINKMLISGHTRAESVGCKMSQSPTKVNNNLAPLNSIATITSSTTTTGTTSTMTNKDSGIYRRSSDSDLSVTPKGNSICVASERLVAATTLMRINPSGNLKSTINQENLDMLEYPFLTMAKYPPGFIVHLGATVAARSVKLLERVPNPDEPETRDSWWTELRMEIRSHARALCCNVVLGYSEVTTISDDVCVLSATGTAAVINMLYTGDATQFEFTSSKKDLMVSSLDDRECLKDLKAIGKLAEITDGLNGSKEFSSSLGGGTKIPFPYTLQQSPGCSMCHIPYCQSSVPFNVKMRRCAICKRGKVPDVLLATIEIPECLQITGRGCFMQAQVVRAKKDLRSESNAKEISDGLPFLEYELHRLLINKLKAKGMNAIFGLKAHVAIGEKMMALIATGTAIFLTALPPPAVPKIVAGNSWTDTARLNDLQKSLQETVERNREIYQLKSMDPDQQTNGKQSDTDDSEDDGADLDLTAGNKDTCVLEVDDIEDLEIISLLMEPCPPEGFHVVNTQSVPGLQDMEVIKNLQMFTQVWRAKLSVGQNNGGFPKHFQRLLQTIYFKLRTMIPCAICDLRFRLDLPESDEIQVLVTGMALGLAEPSKLTKIRRKALSATNSGTSSLTDNNFIITNGVTNGTNKPLQDDDLIFSLDDDQNVETTINNVNQPHMLNTNFGSHSLRLRKQSPPKMKFSSVRFSRHLPVRDRYGVDVTPLSYVPGGKIEKYLGNLNFFFIRESTSIREIGGISGFVHSFITELLAVVRAHVSSLGGNAMVSFYMTELILVDNQHKNQGQCLISVGGDVVHVSYFTDD